MGIFEEIQTDKINHRKLKSSSTFPRSLPLPPNPFQKDQAFLI
jgi:hypothetical protein